MSTAELNLQSGIWLMLFVEKRASGWPVRELMATLSALVDDAQLAPYLAAGAEENFRRFVREKATHFQYDAQKDTIALANDSPSTAVDRWLVRYLSQLIQASKGSLEIGAETSAKCQSAVPKCMADHLRFVYGGNLKLFFKTHPTYFTVDESGNLAQLTVTFYEESIATFAKEESLVLFFTDLLQKIGATKDKPCHVHTLTKYLPFMKDADKKLLGESYRANLNVFFLLNGGNFATTKVEKGFVFLKNYDPDYGTVLFLKQKAHILSTCASGHSPKISLAELATRVKYSASPIARSFCGVKSVGKRLRDIVRRFPAMFHMDELGEKLWLRAECPPLPQGQWDADAELLSVAFFIDVLKHIDATSPSRAICFNYIIRAASAAPSSCKDYLESIYPALEVIGLFHLHPGIFDLSTVNRVCLKTTDEAPGAEELPADTGTESVHDNAEKEAVLYAEKLLKYVPDLSPDLLIICMESASLGARSYCMTTVKGRPQSVIETARATLVSLERVQALNSTNGSLIAKTTSEASTQTAAELTPMPVTCDSGGTSKKKRKRKKKKKKQCTSQKKKTVQDDGEKANVPRNLLAKSAKKKAATTHFAKENVADKDSVASAPSRSSNSAAMSGTQQHLKAEQQTVLPELTEEVSSQSAGDELLAALQRLAVLSPGHLEAVVSLRL